MQVKAIENFSANLKAASAALGINQSEIERASGISRPYVNRVFGQKVDPSISCAEQIATAFRGIPFVEFLLDPEEFSKRLEHHKENGIRRIPRKSRRKPLKRPAA